MRVTFLEHSGFLVELPSVTLLFDWWKGELPALRPGVPLLVFSSHRHEDHFNPEIFRLNAVAFLLGSDIRLTGRNLEKWGISKETADRCVRLGKHDTVSPLPGVTVETLPSTDEGVAFLVTADRKTVFHAGDLNWWHWEGEDPAWNDKMARDFTASCDRLRGVRADAAFLPLDPRQEDAFWWGFHRFMTTLDAGTAFPMHCWGDFSVIPRLKSLPQSAPYRDRVADIIGDGESFLL